MYGGRLEKYKNVGRVVDFGASPFIVSCALKFMGFEAVAVDFDPEEYGGLLKPAKSKLLGQTSRGMGYR